MTKIDACLRKIAQAKARVTVLNDELKRLQGETEVKCKTSAIYGVGCGATHSISTLDYIQTYYYVSPYGCSGGDYYKPSEGQFICPTCGRRNRLYDRPEIEELKHAFRSIVHGEKEDNDPAFVTIT